MDVVCCVWIGIICCIGIFVFYVIVCYKLIYCYNKKGNLF